MGYATQNNDTARQTSSTKVQRERGTVTLSSNGRVVEKRSNRGWACCRGLGSSGGRRARSGRFRRNLSACQIGGLAALVVEEICFRALREQVTHQIRFP